MCTVRDYMGALIAEVAANLSPNTGVSETAFSQPALHSVRTPHFSTFSEWMPSMKSELSYNENIQ